ncbi:MAG: hypothetical protein R8M11_02360 [Gallionella sp.]
MSYSDNITSARRLSILLALYFAPGYTLLRPTLHRQVELTGYITSSDKMTAEISWLTEMDLVEPLELNAVRLTNRGEDLALGRSLTSGVRRHSPGEIAPGEITPGEIHGT